MENKQYIVTINGRSQTWDADKYTRNEKSLKEKYPDSIVQEVSGFANDEQVRPDGSYLITIGDQQQVWDGEKLNRNKAHLQQKYPNATIGTLTTISAPQQVDSSMYYPSPLSEEGKADVQPISAEERSKQEYDMLMRHLNEFNAANGDMMDTYEAYEKAAMHQVNEGGFAIDTPERRYLDENSNEYHQRKMERDELNTRIKNNSYFNQMRMSEADLANEAVEAIDRLMANNAAENTKLHKKMQAMNALAMNPRGSFSGFSRTKEMQEYMDERDDLLTAKRLYENTAQVYAAPINDGEDILKKFGQGFGQRLDDADFWSMGIVGIADDMNARAAFQKIQDKFGSVKEFANLTDAEIDALLTPSEQLLISAVMDNNAALYARKDNTAGAYQAGAGAADSLMFMAQFLLTGGIGDAATVGTAAHKRLVNWLGRKVGSMGNGLMKDVARGAVKLGVGTAESIGKALVMTPLMPHTYANIADKMMSFDDNGELMDTTDAIISGSIDALIETWSESTGDFVNKILGVPGDITKGIAKKALKNVDFSDWGKAMNAPMMKILRKGGFNGFLGEMGEEFIGNATRSLVGTLAPGSGQDPEALKNFAQWEQLLVTAGSFAPMTIFGIGTSSAQYGLAKRKLANAQSAFEAMLREASYTEDQTKFIIDELLGSTDAHLTPERLVANFSPLLRELAFNDRFANNRTQAMQSAVDFMWEIARYRTFDGVYHRQEEQQRNDMLAEIQEGTGREFWTTRLSENAGLDGTAYETDEVRAVEFNDGRVAYVLGGDGVNNTVVYNDGQTGFLSEEQLNDGKANGSIVSDATMGLNDYLTQQVARVRMTEEEQRMFTERNSNIGAVRAQFPIDATVELGTTEAPIQGVVRQQTPNGVIVESPAGISQLTWEELGRTIGVEVNPQTDAQMEEEAINNLEIADLQRRREREQRRAQRNPAAEEALEAEQMVDEAENEGLEKPIPMKADGTVDQTAFWNESPARWAQWKTEQRQDGGAYASTYIQNAINILEGQIAESEAAFLAESDFDAKDAIEQTINQQRARLAELQGLAMQYAPSTAPVSVSAEATAEQTQPSSETSQPAAVMADRQKFELDAEYQRRLSLAKALAEKEMILKEYFEAISAGSMEAVVMNKQNYKQVMKDMGCDESAIEMVTNAIKFAEEENKAVDALHVNDKIFIVSEYITSIEGGRVSYVHERQHNITKNRPELVQRILSLGLGRETMQKIVRMLSGSEFYEKKSDEVLADEILSFTMEIAYTFDEFSVTLSKLGIPIELINLINEINDEQRKDFTLVNARRNANALDAGQRDSGQNDRDSGEVSGGILGQEGVRPSEDSERGAEAGESGEPATGGAEASEEGLQVPVAEVDEEPEEKPEGPDFRVTKPEDNLSDETKKELADKGLVMDGGAIMSDDYAELKHELGYETPIERNTDLDDLRFSYGTRHAHIANYLQHPEAEQRVVNLLERLAERLSMNELVFGVISKATKHTYGKKLPGSVAGPLRSNVEYIITFDLDTSCPRTFQYLNLVKRIERRIGRPLTQTECIQLIEMMRMYGQQIPCVYCYAENKRQALKQYYTDFIEARHGVLSAATDEEALEHMYGHTKEQSNDPKIALTEAAYNVFVEWRKNPKGMYNPTIKMLWNQYTNDRNSILTLLDTMLADKGISIDATDAKIAASVAAEFGVTNAKAKKVIEEIVAEWKWDVVEGKEHDQFTPVEEDDWGVNERALEVWRDMTAYAKSASSAKSVIRYTPYTDELKEISQEDKDYINGMGGVRMHSSNDFRIDYVFDYFQFMADMALYKMFGHTYTKSPEFVRIFGNSGYKINMSIAAYQDENGKIRPNADEGFDWEEAKALRLSFPNAGTMLMATSDEQIQMALDSDWIDMCIPFHHSGLPKAVWYNMRMWQDYTSIQKELFLNSGEMKDALKADGVIIPKKAKADEIANLYNEHFNVKVLYDKKGKRIRPHFLPGPTVVDGHNIPGHNNDHQRYLDLCREYGVKPRFAGMQVRDNSPEGGGRVIDVTEHPRYMIFIKETARTDSPQTAIQFNFDEPSEALGGKTPMEYAFDELEARAMAESELEGGPVKDIYNSLNKDQFGIADQFIGSIIKHKNETGEDYPLDYITPESREWFLVQRKALEEAFKDVEAIPYHRNEYDEQGNLTENREGVIDLVEEARKADLRHRVAAEGTLIPGHKKGEPMLSDAEMMDGVISFRISNNTKATIESWFEKAGVDKTFIEETINYLDSTFEDTTEQLCAAKWYLSGIINLPDEDVYKVRDAVKVAKQNKVDALAYESPMDILDKFGMPKEKVKPINPDTVSTLKNKREVPGLGVTIYDVEESEESRKNMREIINTHYGKNASPWCLLQGDSEGNLTKEAADFWERYSAYPKQVAFKRGKLLAFCANDSKERLWWNRMDKPYEGIPISKDLKDEQKRKATEVYNPKNGEFIRYADVYNKTEKDGYTIRRNWDTPDGPMQSAVKLNEDAVVARFNRFSRADYATALQYWLSGKPNGVEMVYSNDASMYFYPDGTLEFWSIPEYRLAYDKLSPRKAWTITTRGSIITEYKFSRKGKLTEYFDGKNLVLDSKRLAEVEVPAEFSELVKRDPKSFMGEAERLIVESGLAEAYEESGAPRFRFAPRTDEQREQLFDKAKAHYGLTNNFNASGYMLPDGSLLDFSEANDGGDPNRRSLDHRDIEGLIMDEGKEYDSRYHYVVDFVDEGAIRMLPEAAGFQLSVPPTAEQRSRLMDYIYKHNGEVIMEITDENGGPRVYVEYNKRTSPSRIFRDMDGYFNEGIVPGIPPLRFRIANENQAIFVSNAAKAVEGIQMGKATPEQWLKMIEKNGGLKAGEDKWMGLSDWLKASEKKTLTKQEVLDYINENMIIIEEQHYSNQLAYENNSRLMDEKYPGWRDAFSFEWDDYRDAPNADILDAEEAAALYNKYNEDKVEVDEDGEIVDDTDRNKVILWGEDLGKILFGLDGNAVRPIHDTREVYTTKGLINRHEIALTVPTIESWGKSDMIHFGDAGDGRAIAWIRFGETSYKTVSEDSAVYNESIDALYAYWDYLREKYGNGWADAMTEAEKAEEKRIQDKYKIKRANLRKKVLVIDEIQSKRHQEGREKGYMTKEERAKFDAHLDVLKETQDALLAHIEKLVEKYPNTDYHIEDVFKNIGAFSAEDKAELRRLKDAYDAEYAKGTAMVDRQSKLIPDAPFDKNWHELAMKRMLRYAAENGYDVIAWTKGDQQVERYGLGGKVESISSTSTTYGGNPAKEIFIDFKNQEFTIYVDTNGNVVDHGEYEGRNLGEIVGKELAVKLLVEDTTLSGDGLRIGGEGMKGFYDKMLPAFMNKYGKKWGVKVEDIELPNLENGLTMHSVPVTEEMKASVMEGQVMFRMRGENESAEEFYNSVVDEYKSKYVELGFIETYPINEETAKRFGYTLEELKETGGLYESDTNISAIFVHDDAEDSMDVEACIFHEQIHFLVEAFPYMKELGKWMRENANTSFLTRLKEKVEKEYTEEWHDEEMLTYAVSLTMAAGGVTQLEQMVPQKYHTNIRQIEKEIGYDRAAEESSRRAGQNLPGTENGTPSRQSAEKEIRRASKKELTAEERRIIREYFPTFGESDVRMRVNSQGKELTEGQQEFFANSKAVDKDGNLLVLYHGTPRAGFTEFKSGWFTTSKEDAISYSGDRKGRLFDPNEKYEPETLVAGDFPLGYMSFDSEEDRAAFLAEYPDAETAMSEAEFDSMTLQADEEYDDLIARKPELQKIWNAYREYERERFVDTTIGDIISNPEAYTEEDLMRAMLAYDSNASLDSLDDMDAAERKDALVSALQNANEETEGGILDMVVPTRVPRNGEGQKHNDLGNRTYEVYANIERPYEIDANGRGSEFVSGDVYRAIEDGLASEEYDGVIVRNWRTGRHQQLGDVVIPKNGSQIKLTSNENPTESSDIQFRITESGESDIRFSIRTKPAPKETITVYKLVRLGEDGQPYPLYIGSAEPMLVKTWLDADSPNLGDLKKLPSGVHLINTKTGESMTLAEFEEAHPEMKNTNKRATNPTAEAINWATMNGMRFIKIVDTKAKQTRYSGEKRAYYNLGIDGSGSVSLYGMRPGWHAGSHPVMRQIGNGPEKNLRADNLVWVRGRISADVDYQDEANANPGNDIPTHIPTDGYYLKATNANAKASQADRMGWYIAGSFIIDEFISDAEARRVIDEWNEKHPDKKLEYDFPRESGVDFDPETDPRLNNVNFRVTGTPTEDVVAEGVSLSPAQLASLAGDIFAALPEESRKKITDGLNGNILGLQDAILQIPTSLATKEEWNDEDRQVAEVVAEQMTKAVGKEMTRPFSASEALWTLYNAVNKSTDLVSEASRALVRRNLGFDSQTLEMEKEARDGVRFRTVGNASANASASMYNRGAANVWTRLKEVYVDMHASVEKLVKAIEKRSGKKAEGFENILMALNQQSSRGLAAMEAYEQKFLNKMFDEIREIMDKTDFKYEDIVRYVILKHGLERNVKMAQRDAKAHYQEIYDDIIAKIKGMNPAQKRTYLTNAQLRDADAKAELARLQAVNTSALTPDQLRDHKKELAKAKKEAAEAAEHLVRAQKIATMTEQDALDELDKTFKKIEKGTDSVYKEMRKNDYSGISSMFYDQLGVDRKNYATEEEYQSALMQAKADKYDNLGDIEGAAQMEVTLFENAVNTDNLWKSINKATKETLRQQYEANMISKDQYLNLRDMFEFYVPLRGFKDNTAEDMYTYYRRPNSTGYTKPILGAEGRKTEAESPFGWIAAMAGSAIASNVKNEAKLALYYFVANRPDNGIATLSKTWFVHTPGDVDANGKKIFRPAYPPFNEDLSSASAKADYEIWQANMRNLQAQGLAYEAGQRLNLGNSVVNISDTNKPEHIVNVKVGGKDYTIVINGNPRAAQAINGDLNIETNDTYNNVLLGPWLRWLSSVNTSYNPEFWATNMMRDVAFTIMAVNIKGDPNYRRKFFKNYRKALKVVSMVVKNEKGTLGNSYIEQQYKDFVKYGGVTGYTQIKDSETWEKEIENYLKNQDADTTKAIKAVKDGLHAFHRFGESLEQVSRFAAFLTAVETGKSINEAINDAKEITVNFNRKGSGKRITIEEAKLLTKNNGQRLNDVEAAIVSGISYLAPIARSTIMFFNASVQALNAWFKLWKANKLRSLSWVIGYATVGVINALIHALVDDDDEYLDIPQYERRSSLMLGGNGVYFKWALPQEMSAFYALGELSVETIFGRNPHQSAAAEAVKVVGDMLPVNIAKIIMDKGGWVEAVPSQVKPFLELIRNEDYKGDVIFNEQKWLSEGERERTANWESAYKGTGRTYIEISKLLNNLTDSKDLDEAGWINIHPESLEHVVESMAGGVGRTVSKLFNFITAAINPEEDVTVKQTPFLNRFLTINDERYKNVHVNDVYDYYAAEAEHAISLQKQYTKDRNSDALKDLRSSEEYKWARIYSKYKKPIKKYQEAIRAADTTNERMELMKQQDELKRKMIKEISDL